LNSQIRHIIEEIQVIEISKKYISELKDLAKKTVVRMEHIELLINTKLDEIDKLHDDSFYSIYLELTGKLEDALDITKDHYLQLRLEYKELQKEVELIAFQIKVLKEKNLKLAALRARLRELIKEYAVDADAYIVKQHRRLIRRIEFKIRIEKEISEAIEEGVFLNKRFNDAIKYLKTIAQKIYKKNKIISDLGNHDVRNIEKYQEKVLRIKHSMVKFKSEINDVFSQLKLSEDSNKYFITTFISQYRNKLARDIRMKNGLVKSLDHLLEQKKLILEFTKTLRKDLRKVKKEIKKLEDKEMEFIKSL